MVDFLLQEAEPTVMDSEQGRQLRMQAEAREGFLQNVVLLDSSDVDKLLSSKAQDARGMASRLKRDGKLFAVTCRGVDLYPAAQIVDGEPSPAMPRILEPFFGDSPWTVPLWLNAPSG